MFRPSLSLSLPALVLAGVLASPAALAVQRVFVASFGNDSNTANNCSFANPCRGFAAAMTMVDYGGEIVALDAAGYGAVTIDRSVTITANPGFYAGISAATGDAITIATPSVQVVLRGLNINGIGAANGISMTDGSRLAIENCVISNFAVAGVLVNAPATVAIVNSLIRENSYGALIQQHSASTISNTQFLGNLQVGLKLFNHTIAGTQSTASVTDSVMSGGQVGIHVAAAMGGMARMPVIRTTLSNLQTGALVSESGGMSLLTISNSMVTGNNYGFSMSGSQATVESLGNNTVRQNNVDTDTPLTAVSTM